MCTEVQAVSVHDVKRPRLDPVADEVALEHAQRLYVPWSNFRRPGELEPTCWV
jgi:hypothetical protein